eukprot:409939-Amphidinium_carterae.1
MLVEAQEETQIEFSPAVVSGLEALRLMDLVTKLEEVSSVETFCVVKLYYLVQFLACMTTSCEQQTDKP